MRVKGRKASGFPHLEEKYDAHAEISKQDYIGKLLMKLSNDVWQDE